MVANFNLCNFLDQGWETRSPIATSDELAIKVWRIALLKYFKIKSHCRLVFFFFFLDAIVQ